MTRPGSRESKRTQVVSGAGRPVGRVAGSARNYLAGLQQVLRKLNLPEIEKVCEVLFQAYLDGRTVFFFGNGGSAALASHMACDFGKASLASPSVPGRAAKRFRAISLADNVPTLSAWANDTAYEHVFAEQLATYLSPADVAFGISGSGNSLNILRGFERARKMGAVTVGLTGNGGGKMRRLVDHAIIVPATHLQHIEDAHLVVAHILYLNLQERMAQRLPAKR